MSRPDVQDRVFEQGEAERQVSGLRAHLREAERLRDRGDAAGAARAEGRAREVRDDLVARLVPRFRGYARRMLPGPELAEDAVVEMGLELCRRLYVTDGRYGYFEQFFNAALKNMILDGIKKVRRENGMDETGRPATAEYTVVSLEGRSAGAEEDAAPLAERVEDPTALSLLEERLGSLLLQRLMERLPSRRHAQIVADRWNDMDWDEVKDRAGVSLRTARNYYNQAVNCLREIARTERWTE